MPAADHLHRLESSEWKTDVFNSIGRKQTLDLRQAVCP
jgi:hypothetical protein